MKKIIALLLICVLAFCLVACGKAETTSGASSDVAKVESETDLNQESEPTSTENGTESDDKNPTDSSSKVETTKPTPSQTTGTTPEHTHSFANGTCTEPAKCACGATEGAAAGHKYVDRVCTVCGEAEKGAVKSSDGTFSILLPQDVIDQCKAVACADADGIEILVGEGRFGNSEKGINPLVFKLVYKDAIAEFEENWKKQEGFVIFQQGAPATNEDFGYKLEKVATNGDFTLFCQYVDDRSRLDGWAEKDIAIKLLDKKAEIIASVKFN